jgi:hypothetical protein
MGCAIPGATEYARAMLEPGDRMPEATVWTAPRESATTHELLVEGPMLVVFYLFDWSAT